VQRYIIGAAVAAVSALVLYLIVGHSEEQYAEYVRPDGRYRVVVYRRPPLSGSMPGQASDAPGRVVLLDASGRELNQTSVEMVQLVEDVQWGDRTVAAKLLFDWKLPD